MRWRWVSQHTAGPLSIPSAGVGSFLLESSPHSWWLCQEGALATRIWREWEWQGGCAMGQIASLKNSHAKALTSRTSECDCIWKRVFKEVAFRVGPRPIQQVSSRRRGNLDTQRHQDCVCMGRSLVGTARRQRSASQSKRPQEKPNLLTRWSWTSSLQGGEKIKSRYLTHPAWDFLMAVPANYHFNEWIKRIYYSLLSTVNQNRNDMRSCCSTVIKIPVYFA